MKLKLLNKEFKTKFGSVCTNVLQKVFNERTSIYRRNNLILFNPNTILLNENSGIYIFDDLLHNELLRFKQQKLNTHISHFQQKVI